jgi:hypothetical protein
MGWDKLTDVSPLMNANVNDIVTLTYLHILSHATAHSNGDVISGGVKLIPRKCKMTTSQDCIYVDPSSTYDEVFTISQYWGRGFFHGTLENLPRLALYLAFLHQHPNIKIHVASSTHPFLAYLDLDPDRFVVGNVKAKILYMPAGVGCGKLSYFSGQILSKELQRHIPWCTNRNYIVLIKRSRRRWFNNHEQIYVMLRTYGRRCGLQVIEYRDDPVPPVGVTMNIFHRALIVIAPHGAGESNMIFSQPGTVLIEGLCNEKKLNLCYQHMAQVLGLRYYGLAFAKSCKEITSDDVEKPMVEYLKLFGYLT